MSRNAALLMSSPAVNVAPLQFHFSLKPRSHRTRRVALTRVSAPENQTNFDLDVTRRDVT